MRRAPDFAVTVDLEKLEELGVSAWQDDILKDTVHIEGSIPPQCIHSIVANDPADLPEKLKAKIVNPLDFSAIPVSDAHELPAASGLFTRDEAMWCDR